MIIYTSFSRIRRIIRDEGESIFTNDFLLKVYNDVQKEFAFLTGIYVKILDLPVPATYSMVYTHLFEEDEVVGVRGFLYSASGWTYTQPWEEEVRRGSTSDATGGYMHSYAWELYYVDGFERMKYFYPDEFIKTVYMAYDQKPVYPERRKFLEMGNTAFKDYTGVPEYYYRDNIEENSFFLYARPEDYTINEIDSDYGVVGYSSYSVLLPTTSNDDYGVIVFTDEDIMDSDYGVVIYYQQEDEALHLVYEAYPEKIENINQTSKLPSFTHRFLEYGVLAMLFSAETDLKNIELAKHFKYRFKLGIDMTINLLTDMRKDRRYEFKGGIASPTVPYKKRLADLPAHYPSYWR
jgi:hypothetical protein